MALTGRPLSAWLARRPPDGRGPRGARLVSTRTTSLSICLVIDDWAMAPLAETERRDFWEICEDRYQTRSTILTSQLPVARWHEQIGDPTAADGILDRLVHNAHRIEMRGDSIRKNVVAHSRRANARRGLCVLRRGQGLPPLSPHPFLRLRRCSSSAALRIGFS